VKKWKSVKSENDFRRKPTKTFSLFHSLTFSLEIKKRLSICDKRKALNKQNCPSHSIIIVVKPNCVHKIPSEMIQDFDGNWQIRLVFLLFLF
jgi:hypothetical protein